jgi:DNA-binding NtrC family response regulator
MMMDDKKKNVLVIDDEEIVRISCQRALGPEGFNVDVASDGIEGLELLRQKAYDVVLTDLKMPNMDGMEVLEQINELMPGAKVIVITGYSTIETAVKAIKMGAYNYVEKPFTPDGLLEAVKEALAD